MHLSVWPALCTPEYSLLHLRTEGSTRQTDLPQAHSIALQNMGQYSQGNSVQRPDLAGFLFCCLLVLSLIPGMSLAAGALRPD